MPLDLNTLINDEFEEIKFNDRTYRVPGYLPREVAGKVIELQRFGDVSGTDASSAKKFDDLLRRQRNIIIGILASKRNGKHINNARDVKRFVKSLEIKDVARVFAFIFEYFKACEDKKKAE